MSNVKIEWEILDKKLNFPFFICPFQKKDVSLLAIKFIVSN